MLSKRSKQIEVVYLVTGYLPDSVETMHPVAFKTAKHAEAFKQLLLATEQAHNVRVLVLPLM